MRALRAISKAIERFNKWFGPAAAATTVLKQGGGGGVDPDPIGLHLLRQELDEEKR
jgi:hypothetical protein